MSRRGEGIYKRKDGRWEARYIHHYENGKAKYRFLYASTYTEVKAKRNAELASPQLTALSKPKSEINFIELTELWLADVKENVKESTFARYSRNAKVYLYPIIGDMCVERIDSVFLKYLPQQLTRFGGKEKEKLSAKTVSDILCVFKSIMKFAKANGYSFVDTSNLLLPKRVKNHADILLDEHRIIIENYLWRSNDIVCLGILLTLYTGIRIGELCGLRWSDVDFVSGVLNIRRTIERISDLSPEAKSKTKVIISEPKTDSSYRVIPLPKFMLEHLEMFRGDNDNYIVTGTMNYTEPHQFYLRYKTFLRKANIPDYTFHTLRHTFATRCIENGFDTKSLSEILGHANIATTLSLYVHPTIDQKRKQMERLTPCI